MKRRLIIPSHIVDRYRERVHEDRKSRERSREEIDFMIGFALYEAGVLDHRTRTNHHVLVNFRDPFERESFGAYYIVLNPADENDGRIACETIKDIPGVLARINDVEQNPGLSAKINRRKKRQQMEKMEHYRKYSDE
jgi:hypothetical protein